jgi:hypothetical protein
MNVNIIIIIFFVRVGNSRKFHNVWHTFANAILRELNAKSDNFARVSHGNRAAMQSVRKTGDKNPTPRATPVVIVNSNMSARHTYFGGHNTSNIANHVVAIRQSIFIVAKEQTLT